MPSAPEGRDRPDHDHDDLRYDLHILKDDVPEMKPGTIFGHEAVGIVEEAGSGVGVFKKGDRVIVPAITSCGVCSYCRKQMYGQCLNGGGWLFGHLSDGLHAEYARVPFADTSLHLVPEQLADLDVLFLTDILATGYECGIVRGNVPCRQRGGRARPDPDGGQEPRRA